MRFGFLLLRASLFIPFFYHGFWNLTDSGRAWWFAQPQLPQNLRIPVGIIEIVCAAALLGNRFVRGASAAIAVIMAGSLMLHLQAGYSYKNGGFETPLSYLLIALAFVWLKPQK